MTQTVMYAVVQNVHQQVFEIVQAPVTELKSRCGRLLEEEVGAVLLCLYELRNAIDDVISEELVALIDRKLGSLMNVQAPDLDNFIRQHLTVDLHEQGIHTRRLNFAIRIKENGPSKILGVGDPVDDGYNDRMKLHCTPKMHLDDVRCHVKYECRETKRNNFMLFGIISGKTRAQHQYRNSNDSNKENPLRIILRPDATPFLGLFPTIFSNSTCFLRDRVRELEMVG
ncbi:hypothetical protein PHMEG_00010363 [Phytophthora megakarya]|uniref:Uncharacterized protein n=1 Tax=Phytophthora megakarya TaxID=4795 RepID=A0A225WF86_9STRA|nr:hypothetical protein PHMEG_00010363 [Phytophthora megakarya]